MGKSNKTASKTSSNNGKSAYFGAKKNWGWKGQNGGKKRKDTNSSVSSPKRRSTSANRSGTSRASSSTTSRPASVSSSRPSAGSMGLPKPRY